MSNSIPNPAEILHSKVFSNQHVLENILSYLSDDFTKNLNVRLINKSINNTFLHLIRKSHRRMKIECLRDITPNEQIPKDWVYVNYRKINNYAVSGYFIFLSTVVNVRVEKIIAKRLWLLEEKFRLILHNLIHSQLIEDNGKHIQSLIGLEEICDGCVKCSNIAQKCLEYGPIRFATLQTMNYPKSYKQLHVTDKLFEVIAEYCISKSSNKEECFRELDNTIPTAISCDTLVIWINETRILPDRSTIPVYDHQNMPREVIDVMLRKWNVKSVKLSMVHFTSERLCNVEWLKNNYFTRFRFNDPYSNAVETSDLKFSQVEVKMSDSCFCARDLGDHHYPNYGSTRGFENLIPNIRRLFPTDKISINLSHWLSIAKIDIKKKMSTILEVVSIEKPERLSLDIQFFVEAGIAKKLNEDTNEEELIGIAPRYCFREKRLQCLKKTLSFDVDVNLGPEKIDEKSWIGRRFQVKDEARRFTFNLDVYIREKELKEGIDKKLLEKYPNSFVGHFYS